MTERVGPGYASADKRPLLVTVLDPCNFGGIFRGKRAGVGRFWEKENPMVGGKLCCAKEGGNILGNVQLLASP